MAQIKWADPTPPYDEDTREGLTATRVYAIRRREELGGTWHLRFRPRVCRTGEHGLAIHDWVDLGDFPTAAVAIVTAQVCEDGMTAAEGVK